LHPSTILVFVGDDAQLPSVGPGNVLRELLACPDVPNVRLTQIFRQSDAGGIVQNSHRINRGEELPLDSNDIEFRFVNIPEEDRITNLVVGMATKLKERDANFQVLAPKYDGVVGIDRLNDALRDRLNPDRGQPEWKVKTLHLREGDRVMVVQNDYQLGIYNGDMGKVMEFTKDDVIIRIHGLGSNDIDVVVEIPKSEAVQKLRLAYAISVHRSQGSEWETVILPITRTQGRMLQRNLFYTAVTRAKKRVWLLGHKDAVTRAVANDRVVQRNTVLARAISDAIQALKAAGVDDDGAGEAEGSARRLDAGTEGPIGEAPVGDTA
jgi:exodeoxyribonuclease V alpha subunit